MEALVEQNGMNGIVENGRTTPPLDVLEHELPFVQDGQVPLGDLLSRVMQAIYAELTEMSETLPNMSDVARKRTLADWAVKIKKQVVKLYAVTKWARDADTVQKCMNITAFLMNQNQQFEQAVTGLKWSKEGLDPSRLRNHDLLTSLDVLTTGSYRRLPTIIKKMVIPQKQLTDTEVVKTLTDMQNAIRYRLRLTELVPVEMSKYRIANGRVYFTVENLFETSLCLRGGNKDDGWFFLNVTFLFNIGGDMAALQEFPRTPAGILRRHITDEADARLAFYLPMEPGMLPPEAEIPPRPQLPVGVIDTPLVRLFNFLQMMSLSYQLEILWYQAERMRTLGWAEYMNITMSGDRKKLIVSYWLRNQPTLTRQRVKLPPFGGTLTVSIVETRTPIRLGEGPIRTPKSRILAELQQKSKLGKMKPSDVIEGLSFEVVWGPSKGAFGVNIPPSECHVPEGVLVVNVQDLDLEAMLLKVLRRHSALILMSFQFQLQSSRSVFSSPGVVSLIEGGPDVQALRVHLCADEVVIISLDPRTGRLSLHDTGDLAAAGRGPRFSTISTTVNENPVVLKEMLTRLRLQTITDLIEQKAKYLGLQTYRRRNFKREELNKLGNTTQGTVYIPLESFPWHYLVIVIGDDDFRYALITVSVEPESMFANLIMQDIAWLNFSRIHGEDASIAVQSEPSTGTKRKRDQEGLSTFTEGTRGRFTLEAFVLRELYSYCCARVAYMNVERQFKLRAIPFTHVNPTSDIPLTQDLAHVQSSLARSVPCLCVPSDRVLDGAMAAEAAMPNIRVMPLNWWSERKAQVVTCVKLKYVQQPMGKNAGSNIIRPSKRIIYDSAEAVVSFLSENVDTCVSEFLEEWDRVSKMVVIAREVAQMAKQPGLADVQLLSFDLQSVQFTYASDYSVMISCEDQLTLLGGNFQLHFSRCKRKFLDQDHDMEQDDFNPHDDAESFLQAILQHGQSQLARAVHQLVKVLRATLPTVTVLEEIRKETEGNDVLIDTFPKSAGWYRVVYGNCRHALDFRLMSNDRMAILDGSYSIFNTENKSDTDMDITPTTSSTPGLQPISEFRQILFDVVRQHKESNTYDRIAVVDVGIICDVEAVRSLAPAIHSRILSSL